MFKINDTLRQDILADIPEDSSKLKTALTIYARLCQKLDYSMDYLINEQEVKPWFRDPENLQKIDGRENKDVVCFTFNIIFAQLLIDSGVCEETAFPEAWFIKHDRISSAHEPLEFTIDGVYYSVDSTYGVINNCDLTESKYGIPELYGWEIITDNIEDRQAACNHFNDVADEVIRENTSDFDKAVYQYIFNKGDDLVKLPLQERFDMFMELLQKTPPYSVHSLNYLIKLKHSLFTREECGKSGPLQNFEMSFVKDKETGEFKVLILYNPQGYVDDRGYENFDSLQIYDFSIKDKTVTPNVDIEHVRAKIDSQEYVNQQNRVATINMIQEGALTITPYPPEDEKLVYDNCQKPVNVDHYERTEKITGKKYECDKNGNNLEAATPQTPTGGQQQ